MKRAFKDERALWAEGTPARCAPSDICSKLRLCELCVRCAQVCELAGDDAAAHKTQDRLEAVERELAEDRAVLEVCAECVWAGDGWKAADGEHLLVDTIRPNK